MIGVADWFKLESGVFDVEMPYQTGLEFIEDPRAVPILEALICHNDIRADRGQVTSYGPDMQVVDVSNVVALEQMGAQLLEDHAFGRSFKQDSTGVAQKAESGANH